MSNPSAMRQLEERHVATKVDVMVWSNKMDLLALANIRGEVALHRLTWQRVWSLLPPSEGVRVKGMTWRPDGKVIAIAYISGIVRLVDVENKEILHSTNLREEISCIVWTQERKIDSDSTATVTDQSVKCSNLNSLCTSQKYLPKLFCLSKSFGSSVKNSEDNFDDYLRIKDQTSLNILLTGVKCGKVYLHIFGIFPCGFVDLRSSLNVDECNIVGVDISENLSSLFVLVSAKELSIVLYDTSILKNRSCELLSLALKHGHILSLLDYLKETMCAITEAWETVLLEMDSKLAAYAETVPPGSVSADFLELLMFGNTSVELEKFLAQDLTEKGLKKLGHSIELSYSNIQKLVLKHLNSVGQNLAYHLAEIRGMARHTARYQVLGLEEETVTDSLIAAGAFLVKSTEVQQVIDNSMRNYKAFFRWLYAALLRLTGERVHSELSKMSQQELSFIGEFLYNLDGYGGKQGEELDTSETHQKPQFNLEKLGRYLLDTPLDLPSATTDNSWSKFLEENSLVSEQSSITPHFKHMSLVQQRLHLLEAVERVFSQPNSQISKHFSLTHIVDCLDIASAEVLRHSLIHVTNSNKLLLAFLGSVPPYDGFYFIEMPTDKMNSTEVKISFQCAFFYFEMSSEFSNTNIDQIFKVKDLQFYLPDVLSVLLEQGTENNRSMIFVQLPTQTAMCSTCSMELGDEENRPGRLLLNSAPRVNAYKLLEAGALRPIENMVSSQFAVSGSRKVAVVLSENGHKVRLFEMEVEEEEDDDDVMDASGTSQKEGDSSNLDASKNSDILDD